MQMTIREVVGRYKGTFFGLVWSFFNPVLMLAIYTYVFSSIFNARFGNDHDESKLQFAVILFVGMIVHGLFSEVLNQTPTLLISNVNFVKKVIFPLEVLPVISLCTSLFHSVISIIVLLVVYAVVNGNIHLSAVFIPLILFPLVTITLGLSWVFTSLCVYFRDLGQTINIATTVLLFLSPVFYATSSAPKELQVWLKFNPLTFIIQQARAVLVYGYFPNWRELGIYSLISILIAWAGYAMFQKTRKGFADVL